MLFHVSWEFVDTSEEAERRSLTVFANWTPPAETQFQAIYGFADGGGGFALVETDSAAAMYRAVAPFSPWLSFTVRPVVPIEEAAQIGNEAIAFRDGII
jgi:hypothetical protein